MKLLLKKHSAIALAALGLAIGIPQAALSGGDLSKPIQMIVSYGAGDSTDIMALIFTKHTEEKLSQRFVVINKPSAGGELGLIYLTNSAPDDYAIGLVNSPPVETHPFTRADTVSYSLDDLLFRENVVTGQCILAVASDSCMI